MISLKDWSVDVRSIRSTGHDLRRPECILAEPDGSLWVSDSRGGLTYISDAGQQRLVLQSRAAQVDRETQPDKGGDLQYGTLPNGLAFDAAGNILVANIGTDRLELTTRAGETRVLCDTIDGQPMRKVNFVLRDRKNRLWITVSTKINPWANAICTSLADGYVAWLDDKGLRIVADGLAFTNEIRMDADED